MAAIESAGFAVVIPCLEKLGQSISKQTGTFDLSVDGDVAELKAKGKPFAKLDFITYTENQYQAIKSGRDFDTYIVCGVNSGETPEVYRLPSRSLQAVPADRWTQYSYSKKQLSALLQNGLMQKLVL